MHLSRHISGTVKHIIMIFGTLVLNDNISRVLFHFLHIFIFWAVMEVKGQEMAQNAKKKCLLHFMYQEPYILWLSFIVDFCKMMISPGFFFHFFEVLKNENHNYICHMPYLRNTTAYNQDFWYTCVKWWYLRGSLSFFEIFIF